ncbi:MAG: hypothetical protein Q8R37_02705 [Nanoarchaeota archaeon]|nr:hypothetical protein [Nanoarchaeota archaeon]
MKKPSRGRFVVVDGLDGIGKGVFVNTLRDEAEARGKRVLDVVNFWQQFNDHPSPAEIIGNYDAILTAEPTFVGVGKYIREELVSQKGKGYSPQILSEAYALDRWILYETLLLPVLNAGIDVYQSRTYATGLVYQRQMMLDRGQPFRPADILNVPGNAFCHRHPIDFLIIPTLSDPQQLISRLRNREKDDNCIFENLDFLTKVRKHYESDELRDIFEKNGTTVLYMDASVSIGFSQQQMRDFYKQYLE